MIKLYQTDNFQQGYSDAVAPVIRKQLKHLKWALESIVYEREVDGISKARLKILRAVLTIVDGVKKDYTESKFSENVYWNIMQKYFSRTKKTTNREELEKVYLMVNSLVDSNNPLLEKILLCPADKLILGTESFFESFDIKEPLYRSILNTVFNYEKQTTISGSIKEYFYGSKLLTACPYCNLKDIKVIRKTLGKNRKIVDGFYLDHFFDKATYPMISFSIFNLVPTDGTCNGTFNKGSHPIFEEYHINPYSEAYNNNIKFDYTPHPLTGAEKIVMLNVLVKQDDPFRKKLLGNEDGSEKDLTKGNIKLFNLIERYENDNLALHFSRCMYSELPKINGGKQSYEEFFSDMKGLDRQGHYRKWYEEKFIGKFDVYNFQNGILSRCLRDIHDTWYMDNSNAHLSSEVLILQTDSNKEVELANAREVIKRMF